MKEKYKMRRTDRFTRSLALKKKIEEGLKDIKAGRTMPLDTYISLRNKRKFRPARLPAG